MQGINNCKNLKNSTILAISLLIKNNLIKIYEQKLSNNLNENIFIHIIISIISQTLIKNIM